ncbi:MAG: YceI family protein [Bacteroidia bacterium]
MKNELSIARVILIIAPLLFSCRGPVNGENKNDILASYVSKGENYTIDTRQSSILWKGSMVVGTNAHTGYIYMSGGTLFTDEGKIVGGTAKVDMNTIEDEAHSRENGLVDHLKSADFFEVAKYPDATFTFTKDALKNTEKSTITGNLTIKGITHPVAFPAKIEVTNGVVTAAGRLIIDRTQWNVLYQSGKFYDLLADQTMSDAIEFDIKIIAKK